MFLTAECEQVTALDPTMQVLLTVFGAALVTALAGGLGIWFQSRRERSHWLREQRLSAYFGMLVVAQDLIDSIAANDEHEAAVAVDVAELEGIAARLPKVTTTTERDELLERNRKVQDRLKSRQRALKRERTAMDAAIEKMNEKLTSFRLLGPKSVREASGAILDARGAGVATMRTELAAMEIEMRKALKIAD